ncbi:MAG: helix-turn-helix transcriptional regulator [Selenomonadaceae bacterium]|nr:helix-turn-helix transcriptional regulator [Selenomonadaceae bacterium]
MHEIHFYTDKSGFSPVYDYLIALQSKTVDTPHMEGFLIQRPFYMVSKGVNQSAIANLEQGVSSARLDTLIRLTRVLDMQCMLTPMTA